ncbi:hypothetical protein Tcan_11946 [Toxocara canis]|uniref:Uncharacterized protein n=2 Tax=Toxocara canis TaxID=6265 RepID=A0A0B2V6Z4_TOXCA|nr:hypothetical protein Tcan_11946 [Toxocara canis]VDM46369.1 unnamed protein product [Toxocara canis]
MFLRIRRLPYNVPIEEIQRIALITDTTLNIMAQIVLSVYLSILTKKQCFTLFHPNLSILFINQALTYFFFFNAELTQNIRNLIAGKFLQPSGFFFYVNVAVDVGIYSIALNLISFVIERLCAAIKFATYEHWCSTVPYLGIAISVAQWIISISLLAASRAGYLRSVLLVSFILIAYFVALVVFLVLPSASRALYERHMRMQHNANFKHSLTVRYQLSTNVSNAKLLNKIVLFISVTSVAGLLVFCIANYVVDEFPSRLLNEVFSIFISLQAIFMCCITVRCKKRLYHELRRMLCRLKKEKSHFVPRTVDGRTLVVPVTDEKRLYFAMYERYWR